MRTFTFRYINEPVYRKGSLDSGYVYAPYIPLQVTKYNGKLTKQMIEDACDHITRQSRKGREMTMVCSPQVAQMIDDMILEELIEKAGK